MKAENYDFKSCDDLTMNEDDHTYFLKGVKIDCVSDLLGLIFDGFANYDALQRGSNVHMAIEMFLKHKIDICPNEYKTYYDAFIKWYEDIGNNLKIVATEQKIYHTKYLYCGTFDLLVLDKNNKLVLVDYKTSDNLNKKRTIAQLSLYAMALKSLGIDVDCAKILLLKSDGCYEYIDIDLDFGIAIALLKINEFLKGN